MPGKDTLSPIMSFASHLLLMSCSCSTATGPSARASAQLPSLPSQACILGCTAASPCASYPVNSLILAVLKAFTENMRCVLACSSLRMATYPLASKHYSLCIRCSDSAQRCVGKSYTSMRASAARLSAASASSLTLFAASPAASPPPSSVVFASSEGSLQAQTCSGHRGYHRTLLMSKSKHVQVLTERRHHANTATCLLWPALLGTPVRPGLSQQQHSPVLPCACGAHPPSVAGMAVAAAMLLTGAR